MSTKLSVNMNAVALLRNRRDLPWPNVEHLGRRALEAGAHGLTVHPRPDERHTRKSDIPVLRALIDDEFPAAEFNIEGFPTDDFVTLVLEHEPEQVTLVPDDPSQATSDHGWDFLECKDFLAPLVAKFKTAGIRVSLFCDPDASEAAIAAAAQTGADRLEIYTEPYAATLGQPEQVKSALAQIGRTAALARQEGMQLNAGHDLVVDNLPALIKCVPDLAEVSIGHGLTADALEFGMAGSVKRFLAALSVNH